MRRRALATVLWACALAALGPAGAHAQVASSPAARPDNSVSLRLADGSIIRIPCDKATSGCASGSAPENAWITGSARRAPLKRGSKLFDAGKPGVVASIRG
ncbi:MAG: hypothetical protein JSS14_16010 [Proteobacteria bacterium]|nr:hypothetical protein [Pseudomonadota bacterium]